MLSLAEEVLLLALDDEKGAIRETAPRTLDHALVAAALMDLALLKRIDTDPKNLYVVDPRPTGDPLLDDLLARLPGATRDRSAYQEIKQLLSRASRIREQALERLIARGVLRLEQQRILWVFGLRRYPRLDDRETREVRTRLRDLVFGDGLPDDRDAVLVSLIEAARLWGEVFSQAEIEKVRPRIQKLAKLDFIGQALAKSIREIEASLAFVKPF